MKKVTSPYCPFCPADSLTLWHLFVDCLQANSFWFEFQVWYSNYSSAKIVLSRMDIMFGSLQSAFCLTLNHLIILRKYFLYVNTLNNSRYHFSDLLSLISDKIGLEKYITATSNQEDKLVKKWNSFLFCYYASPL